MKNFINKILSFFKKPKRTDDVIFISKKQFKDILLSLQEVDSYLILEFDVNDRYGSIYKCTYEDDD